jgi:hypothetical protein
MTRPIGNRWLDPNRSARVQQLVKKLIACGERPVHEAFVHIAAGSPLQEVLESFTSIAPEDYQAVRADKLPIDELVVVDGDDA